MSQRLRKYGTVHNNLAFTNAWDIQGNWTNPGGAISTDNWASTSSTSPLFLAATTISLDFIDTGGLGLYQWSIDDLREQLQGYGDHANPGNRALNVCLTLDSGQSCTGNPLTLTAPLTGGSNTIPSPGSAPPFPGRPFERWGAPVIPHRLINLPDVAKRRCVSL